MTLRCLFASVLGASLAAQALAWDPRLPVLGAEPDAEEKVTRFALAFKGDVAVQAAIDASARAGTATRDRIHAALLATNPDYARAFAAWEQTGDNADDWRALLERAQKEQVHLRAHASYLLGRALLARDELDGAAAALEAVRGRMRLETPWSDEATLWLAYTFARSIDGGQANTSRVRQLLETLVPGEACEYPGAPERVVEGARWLLRELDGEGLGPLLELAKRMETIERLLRRTETGRPTKKRQEDVIVSLDKLIEMMREKEQGGGGQGGGQGGKQGKGQQPGPGGQQPGGTRPPGGPAQNSQLPGGEGRVGELAEGRRDATGEEWGSLRDVEREEAAQFLRERFPARYRELLEQYYRALAEEDR